MKSKNKIPSDMFAFMRELIKEVINELYLNKKFSRNEMPQLDLEDIKEDYGFKKVLLPLSKMKPVQIERVEKEFQEAIEKIKNGTAKPLILDKFGRIVNGHHRYDAYKALGIKEAPVIIVDATLEELVEAYNHLTSESLHNWFNKEDWVRITTAGDIAGPCGTSKNKKNPDRCLPRAKAQSLTKAERAATARKKKKAGAKGQQVVKNTKKATVKKETANPQDGKAAPYGSGYRKVTKEDIKNLIVGLVYEARGKEVLTEKDDRCTRIAKQKYDTWPSAYASGAVVRCRRGEIWKKK